MARRTRDAERAVAGGRGAAGTGSGNLATSWQEVRSAGRSPTGYDLADVLRQFHSLPPPDFGLPVWRPVGPIRERIAEARGLADDDLAFLLAACDETTVGNLIPGPDGPVICDFDSTSTGPREWGLTPAAVGKLRFN